MVLGSSGVTAGHLNLDGKTPPENDRFESLAIISEKTEGQCFKGDVGMKSTDDDLASMDVINLRTSSTETLAMDSKTSFV